MSVTYAEVLAKNVRSARARLYLEQEPLAARMRALGFTAWRRQTVASVERHRRRLTAEEILGLSFALETSAAGLLSPSEDDQVIEFMPDAALSHRDVLSQVWGFARGIIIWDGEKPRRGKPDLGESNILRLVSELASTGVLGRYEIQRSADGAESLILPTGGKPAAAPDAELARDEFHDDHGT